MRRAKSFIKFLLLALFATVLLWLSLGSLQVGEGQTKLGFIITVWNTANKPFLLLSAIFTITSHVFRSERWKLLINPLGHPLHSLHSFFSVMIGYFVNLAVPRGGEISRCYNLYKLNGTPMDQSFGTVVAERVIDLFFLVTVTATAFLVEIDSLLDFFQGLDYGRGKGINWMFYVGILLFLVASAIVAFYAFRTFFRTKFLRVLIKVKTIITGLKKGILAVFKIRKRGLFIFYSLGIWVMYFLMSYTIILAFPETENLGILDSLAIFAIGGIAMAIPLPGGTGSYHVLVPLGLVMLFNIKHEEAIAFSFIFHGWQTLMIILLGIFSLLGSQWYIRKRKHVRFN